MATVEQAQTTIAVENPATGEIIREVPVTDDVAAMVARARAAQSAWEALGFEGRGRILRRARRGLLRPPHQGVGAVVAGTGQAGGGPRLGGLALRGDPFRFLGREAPEEPGGQKGPTR